MRRAPDLSRLSVVIPTYNRRESLCRCLQGALACETSGLAVVVHVVDDGSTDDTHAMVEQLQRENANGPIHLTYHTQANQGPGAARNLAVAAADTDVVVFLDDDCVPQPGWLKALAATPWPADVGAVGGRIISPESDNWVSRYCRFLRYNEFPPLNSEGRLDFVDTANSAFLRGVILKIGGLEPLVSGGGEAHDLSWRISLEGYRLLYQPEAVVLHYHRETLQALTRAFFRKGYRGRYRAYLSGWRRPPSGWSLLRKSWRLVRKAAQLLLVPFHALGLARKGVPSEDRLKFAYLSWLLGLVRVWGEICIMRDVRSGLRPLQRTRPVPPGGFEHSRAPRVETVSTSSSETEASHGA
jgi:GT2 family glycosyltransferase